MLELECLPHSRRLSTRRFVELRAALLPTPRTAGEGDLDLQFTNIESPPPKGRSRKTVTFK